MTDDLMLYDEISRKHVPVTTFLVRERDRQASLRLRRGLHDALELNHVAEHAPLPILDDALGALRVRL